MKAKNIKSKKQKKQSLTTLTPEQREELAAQNRGNKLVIETQVEKETPIPVIRVDNIALETENTINVSSVVTTLPVAVATLPVARRTNKGRQNVSMIESPDKKQGTDWNFLVEQEELKTKAGSKTGLWAVVRQDNGLYLGKYSGVKVVQYPDIINAIEDGLRANGLPVNREIVTTKSGARMFARYPVGDTKAGEEAYGLMIGACSSHDGSLTPSLWAMFKRLTCLNAMEILQRMFQVSQKHREKFDVSFISTNIVTALESGTKYLQESVERMGNIAIDNEQARNILSNIVTMGVKVGVSPRLGYLIHHNWINPSADETPLGNTLYRLCNAATRVTRDIEKVGRFELSRKANRYLVGAFDLAARRDTDLARLLATPTQPLDFDRVQVQLN